jgi:DeoR/GlpR family transcriptional regulator of sugar metabolism
VFAEERRKKLLQILIDNRSVSVIDSAVLFDVTEETIRRDLKLLESHGLLQRTHGGAILSDDSRVEPSLEVRQGINSEGKDRIGQRAASMVKDGDTIILDASTSALSVARHIRGRKGLTVITNAEKVITELVGNPDIALISTGGILRRKSLSYIGRAAENTLSSFQADKAFLSCKGFTPQRGFTDSSEQESDIRKQMILCSQNIVYLCDYTKMERVGFVTTAKLADVDVLITDKALPQEWAAKLSESDIQLIIAE